MTPHARAALERVIADAEYRAAVQGWIDSTTIDARERPEEDWIGKRNDSGAPVMNICTGGDPVTVEISVIRYVIANGRLPDSPA